MLFFRPSKKLPLLYNAIIRTGLAGMAEMPPLDEVGSHALLPPYCAELPEMSEEQLRGVLIAHVSIFLHNALMVSDFPANSRLKNLFQASEKKLRRIKQNPWTTLLFEYGKRGECPIPEDIENTLDPLDKVALSMARPEWENTVPKIIVLFVDWLVDNREAVERWHLNRLQYFSNT